MEPGENRWLGVTFRRQQAERASSRVSISSSWSAEPRSTGSALARGLGTQKEALAHTIERHRSVFTRLQALGDAKAKVEVKAARVALRKLPAPASWLTGLSERWEGIATILRKAGGTQDPVGIAAAIKRAQASLKTNPADALVAVAAMLERVDITLTMRELERGDRADILQTARWQAESLPTRRS